MSKSRRNKLARIYPPVPQARELGLTCKGPRNDRWMWNPESTIFILQTGALPNPAA